MYFCPHQVALVGQVTETEDAKPYPVNVVLLQGELSASTGDCGEHICMQFNFCHFQY